MRHGESTAAPVQRARPVSTLGAAVVPYAAPPPMPTRQPPHRHCALSPTSSPSGDRRRRGSAPAHLPRTAPPLTSPAFPARECDTPPTRPATPLSPPASSGTPAVASSAQRTTTPTAPPTRSFGRVPSPTAHRPRHGSPPPLSERTPTPTVVRPVSVRLAPADQGAAVRPSARHAPRASTRVGAPANGTNVTSPRRAGSAWPASPQPSRLLSASPNSPYRAPESPFRASVAARPSSATAPSQRSSELLNSFRADTPRPR